MEPESSESKRTRPIVASFRFVVTMLLAICVLVIGSDWLMRAAAADQPWRVVLYSVVVLAAFATMLIAIFRLPGPPL